MRTRCHWNRETVTALAVRTLLPLFVGVVLAAVPDPVRAQTGDLQARRLGEGLGFSLCVDPGIDGIRDSNPGGDDNIPVGSDDIQSGPNGICESIPNSLNALGDDAHPTDITFGQGAAFKVIIKPQNDNVCRSPVNLKGDDVQRVPDPTSFVPIGSSIPRQAGIHPLADTTIESVAGGDDVVTSLICPTTVDNSIESVAAGDDVFSVGDARCDAICESAGNACITPGPDDTLDTAVAVTDQEWEYVSTGANGVCNSTAAGTDLQIIVLGEGAENTICVDGGADGITQTLLCGNGVADVEENGILVGSDCEDGNEVSGDGCSTICEPEICGDGVVQAGLGEECDDANSDDDDVCVGCQDAECGDGFTCTDGVCTSGPGGGVEECDDGDVVDGDGCDSDCSVTACGNGIVTAGETCDDGDLTDGDGCDSNCTPTGCGNGVTTAGEECDDGNNDAEDGCGPTCLTEVCGDGIVQAGLGEECEDGNAVDGDGCDTNCTFTACGNGVVTAGEACDDGNNDAEDGCSPACDAEVCGDGIVQAGLGEICDDGNANGNDPCVNCLDAICGDAIVCSDGACTSGPGSGPEDCDDGNTKNNDACVVGCVAAECGDGFEYRTVEECDDGNLVDGDGCSSTCTDEIPPECGNGIVDGACSAGNVGLPCLNNADCDTGPPDGVCDTEECDDGNSSNKDDCINSCQDASCGDGFLQTKGTPPFEECDDANTAPGDGCSATCENECGNGVIDGACSQGLVGQSCATNGDCDTGPPDGVCVTEECDWAISGLCFPGPTSCSNVCLLAACGNYEVECEEQCDLGVNNGVSGSGCTATCTRNLIGKKEITGKNECPGAWTLDSPPQDVRFKNQKCTDGDACDFDATPGQCTFRVGVCLNRPEPASCTAGGLLSLDLIKLKVTDPIQAAAAEDITTAVAALAPGSSEIPDRCRVGVKNKVCSIPDNEECDTFLGAGNGLCDIGTGVTFDPPLDPGDQVTTCTPGIDVVVPVEDRLKLRTKVRRLDLKTEKDSLRLRCLP